MHLLEKESIAEKEPIWSHQPNQASPKVFPTHGTEGNHAYPQQGRDEQKLRKCKASQAHEKECMEYRERKRR